MTGWYLMHRGWQDSLIFEGDEFSRRDAWVWLIEQAAFKSKSVRVGSAYVDIQRGQLTASIRFMAQAWGWHRNRVSRFIDQLRHEGMIETGSGTEGGTGQLVITICKYDDFQTSPEEGGTVRGAESGTGAGQNIKKENKIKESNGSEEPKGRARKKSDEPFVLPDDLPADEWDAFVEMRKRIKKPMTDHAKRLAVGKLHKLRSSGHDPTDVLNQSTLNSWQDLYPIKENRHERPNSHRDGRSAWLNESGTGLGGAGDGGGLFDQGGF